MKSPFDKGTEIGISTSVDRGILRKLMQERRGRNAERYPSRSQWIHKMYWKILNCFFEDAFHEAIVTCRMLASPP